MAEPGMVFNAGFRAALTVLPVALLDPHGLYPHNRQVFTSHQPDGGFEKFKDPPGWDEFDVPAAGSPYGEFNYALNEDGTLVRYGHAPAAT